MSTGRVTPTSRLTSSHATPRGLSHPGQFRQTGASASARELARASHSNIRAALASDTVFGGTVNRLEPFCGAMHDTGGGEALRVVLEERASACVTVVGAIATVLYSIAREAAEYPFRLNGSTKYELQALGLQS